MDNKRNIHSAWIISFLMATAIAGPAQDSNTAVAMDSSSANNTYINSTVFANNTTATLGAITLGATPLNTTVCNSTVLNQSSSDLDAAGMSATGVVSIDNMAKMAPEVTASSAAAQTPANVPYDPGDSIKLGKVIGGWDPCHSNLTDDNIRRLGMSIQATRDTGRMVFVCNIV